MEQNVKMEFLEVPLFDDDLYKLVVRFVFNLIFVFLVVVWSYFPREKKNQYVFTFILLNVLVFFICFTLKKLDLGIGIGLGLFAIFGIIRYRTDTIKVKEMTYLFIVIGIAVINALSNKKTSYAELMFVNVTVVATTMIMEQFLARRNLKLPTQSMTYDKLDLLFPARREELLADLVSRTGLNAKEVKISKIDLKNGTASISVAYEA
jgi:hypothetical protein